MKKDLQMVKRKDLISRLGWSSGKFYKMLKKEPVMMAMVEAGAGKVFGPNTEKLIVSVKKLMGVNEATARGIVGELNAKYPAMLAMCQSDHMALSELCAFTVRPDDGKLYLTTKDAVAHVDKDATDLMYMLGCSITTAINYTKGKTRMSRKYADVFEHLHPNIVVTDSLN